MSVQAVAWALAQKLPPGPKVVLLALADRADPVIARIDFDAADIAGEACVSPKALGRYVEALFRNGYVRKGAAVPGDEKAYYLALDRPPTRLEAWSWHDRADNDDLDPDASPLPARFSRAAQANEIQRKQAAAEADKARAKRVFVWHKSDAWQAWLRYKKVSSMPVTTSIVDGKTRHGWFFPSLFPPQPELPIAPPAEPASPLMTDDDYEALR